MQKSLFDATDISSEIYDESLKLTLGKISNNGDKEHRYGREMQEITGQSASDRPDLKHNVALSVA